MSLYKGDNLISGHQVLYSTTGNNTDGAMTQSATTTELNGKADIDLSNLSAIGQKVLDGQWVNTSYTIANNVAWTPSTTQTYSLATYLPDDGQQYEVLFIMSGSIAANNASKILALVLKSDISNPIYITEHRAESSTSSGTSGNAIIPVGTGRSISQMTSGSGYAFGSYSLIAQAYRRIGTNS